MTDAPMWFRITSLAMAALYAVSVALQYNDPDPIRWMLIYGAAAVASAALPRKRWAVGLAFTTAIAAAIWAGLLIVQIWGKVGFSDLWLKMSEKGGAVEVEREFGGLAIVAGWLLIAVVLRRRQLRG
jgi:Transmembrane family 220, helix